MKTKIDKEGRIVIPKIIRKSLQINKEEELTIEVKNGEIIIKKIK